MREPQAERTSAWTCPAAITCSQSSTPPGPPQTTRSLFRSGELSKLCTNSNPTHGSGWMGSIGTYMDRTSVCSNPSNGSWRIFSFQPFVFRPEVTIHQLPLVGFGLFSFDSYRLEQNNPPTAVGGIRTF